MDTSQLTVSEKRRLLELLRKRGGVPGPTQQDQTELPPVDFAGYRTPMPAATTRVDPSYFEPDIPKQKGLLRPGTTEAIMSRISSPRLSLAEGLPGERMFEGDIAEKIRRVAGNLALGATEFIPSMALSLAEDPIGTAKGLVEFFPDVATRIDKALGPGLAPGMPIETPSGRLIPRKKVTEPERVEARRELGEDPFAVALAALPFLKGIRGARAPKAAVKAKPIEPARTIAEKGPIKPVAERPPVTKPTVGPAAVEAAAKPQLRHAGLRPKEVIKSVEAIGKGIKKTATEVSRITDEIVQKAKTPPEIKLGVEEAKTAMIEHDRQIRRAESTSTLFKKTIEEAVPKIKGETLTDSRQMLMLHAFEQGRKSKYWRQMTEAERGMVEWALKEKGKLDRFIDEHKVLDRLEMPEGMHHISHWWINPKSGKPFDFMYGKFTKTTPLAKQRKIPTFEAGMAKGLTPASTNLGEIIGKSWESVMRAHQSREMFKTLHSVGAAKEGMIQLTKAGQPRPIRMIERWDQLKKQGLTEGYERYSHDALDKPLTFRSADGTLVRLRGAVGVRTDLAPFVKAYLESPTYTKLDQLNFATKSLKLGVSLFHVMSLGAQEAANLRVPFFNIRRGLRLRRQLDPTVRLLHQEGLELFKGYEDVGYRNSFFEGASPAGKAGNIATYPIKIMRDFIFDVVQPGMKTSFAVDTYNALLPKYLKKGLTKEQCARDVVKKADGHFSGEHYKRSLLETNRWMVKAYFEPDVRRWWQRMLLSPTWQREHLLVAKNVAKSFMTDKMIRRLRLGEIGPIKSKYRRYALGGILMVGAADLYNYMMTQQADGKSKHLWENPEGKGFAVRAWWDAPDYKTTDKSGKTKTIRGGPAYVRPLKSVFEVAEWGAKPAAKLSYKLSPAMSALLAQLPVGSGFGSRYKGWDLPKRTRDYVFDVGTPITFNQFLDWKAGRKTAWGATLPFFGMPTSKVKRPPKKAR